MTLSIVLVRLGFISLAQATAALTCTVCSDLCVAVPPDLAIDRFNAIVSSDLLFFHSPLSSYFVWLCRWQNNLDTIFYFLISGRRRARNAMGLPDELRTLISTL